MKAKDGGEVEWKTFGGKRGKYCDTKIQLAFFVAKVRVEAFGLEHDEEGSPSEQHGGEEQVLDDGGHRHPPAPGERRGQARSHGRGEREEQWGKKCRETTKREGKKVQIDRERERATPRLTPGMKDHRSLICEGKVQEEKREGGGGVSLSLEFREDRKFPFFRKSQDNF